MYLYFLTAYVKALCTVNLIGIQCKANKFLQANIFPVKMQKNKKEINFN